MKNNKKASAQLSRRQFLRQSSIVTAGVLIVPRYVIGGKGYTAPSDMISLGFIGTGKQAMGLQGSFLRTGEAQVVAACDVYQTKVQRFTDKANAFYASKAGQASYKSCTSHADFRELLNRKDVDAVVVATPDHWHAAAVVRTAQAGKDIYCEKPLSLTINEGKAMVEAVKKHHRVFQTGSMQRSWTEFRQAANLVRNGYIGQVKTVKVSVGGPPDTYNLPAETLPEGLDWDMWLGPNTGHESYNNQIAPLPDASFWARWRYYKEFGGGDLSDWGAHMFDIAQWGLDMDKNGPVEIIPPDGKDYQYLTFKYANGITMTHENFGRSHAVRFIGTEGQVDVERGKLETTPANLKDLVIPDGPRNVYKSTDHYKDWLQAIRTRSGTVCDVETGHSSASICNLANIAYELKRPLKWDPKSQKFKGDREAEKMCGREMRKEWSV